MKSEPGDESGASAREQLVSLPRRDWDQVAASLQYLSDMIEWLERRGSLLERLVEAERHTRRTPSSVRRRIRSDLREHDECRPLPPVGAEVRGPAAVTG